MGHLDIAHTRAHTHTRTCSTPCLHFTCLHLEGLFTCLFCFVSSLCALCSVSFALSVTSRVSFSVSQIAWIFSLLLSPLLCFLLAVFLSAPLFSFLVCVCLCVLPLLQTVCAVSLAVQHSSP